MQYPSDPGKKSKTQIKRFRRNTLRNRLAGVCQGIEDYTGVDARLLRLLFLLSILFGGLGIFLYFVIWLVFPGIQRTPIPRLKGPLAQSLRQLDKKVKSLHRSADPALAGQAESALDALKVLSLSFNHSNGLNPKRRALFEEALTSLPSLMERASTLPSLRLDDPLIAPVTMELSHWQSRLSESALTLMEENYPRHEGSTQVDPQFEKFTRQFKAEDLCLPAHLRSSHELLGAIREKLQFLFKAIATGQIKNLGPKTAYHIEQIAFTHLPESIRAYSALPDAMTAKMPLRNQKTADETLEEQLRLMDQTLGTYARDLFQDNARSLLIQGRFLNESFNPDHQE